LQFGKFSTGIHTCQNNHSCKIQEQSATLQFSGLHKTWTSIAIEDSMVDDFEIESVNGDQRVELKTVGRDYIEVTVTGSGLAASAKVAQIGGGDGLHHYWADLSENWRGWSGEKVWQSYEGDLMFSATCDRTGHVTMKLILARGTAWKWKIQTVIAIEAGQLERLAASAFAFARQLGAK
jgi:hypothetical protein